MLNPRASSIKGPVEKMCENVAAGTGRDSGELLNSKLSPSCGNVVLLH